MAAVIFFEIVSKSGREVGDGWQHILASCFIDSGVSLDSRSSCRGEGEGRAAGEREEREGTGGGAG